MLKFDYDYEYSYGHDCRWLSSNIHWFYMADLSKFGLFSIRLKFRFSLLSVLPIYIILE